jgi:hypothetical protein
MKELLIQTAQQTGILDAGALTFVIPAEAGIDDAPHHAVCRMRRSGLT